jgi:hypothetical protein
VPENRSKVSQVVWGVPARCTWSCSLREKVVEVVFERVARMLILGVGTWTVEAVGGLEGKKSDGEYQHKDSTFALHAMSAI